MEELLELAIAMRAEDLRNAARIARSSGIHGADLLDQLSTLVISEREEVARIYAEQSRHLSL